METSKESNHSARQTKKACSCSGRILLPFLIATLFFALFLSHTPAAFASAAQKLTTEQIVTQMQLRMGLPARVSYRQDGEASGVFGRYRWSAQLTHADGKTEIQATGLPPLVTKELLSDISDFEKVLESFRLEYKGTVMDNGVAFHLLECSRKLDRESGAIDGRIWIDAADFRIKKMEARYTWGRLKVENAFVTLDGFTLLSRQEATISPLPMRMTITYHDYSIGI